MGRNADLFPEKVMDCFYELKTGSPSDYREAKLKQILEEDSKKENPVLLTNGRKSVNLYKPTVLVD